MTQLVCNIGVVLFAGLEALNARGDFALVVAVLGVVCGLVGVGYALAHGRLATAKRGTIVVRSVKAKKLDPTIARYGKYGWVASREPVSIFGREDRVNVTLQKQN